MTITLKDKQLAEIEKLYENPSQRKGGVVIDALLVFRLILREMHKVAVPILRYPDGGGIARPDRRSHCPSEGGAEVSEVKHA